MEKTTFVVVDENTFGYTTDRTDKSFFKVNVMAVNHLRGGEPLLLNHQILAYRERSREATRKDFEDYKISIKGYEDDEQYVFVR